MTALCQTFAIPYNLVNNSMKSTHQQQVSELGIDLLDKDSKCCSVEE